MEDSQNRVMPIIVASQVQCYLTEIQDMNQVLAVCMAQGTGISSILPPQVEVCVVGKCVMCCIEDEFEGFIWKGLNCFSPAGICVGVGGTDQVPLPRQALEIVQASFFFLITDLSLGRSS